MKKTNKEKKIKCGNCKLICDSLVAIKDLHIYEYDYFVNHLNSKKDCKVCNDCYIRAVQAMLNS